MVGCLHKINCKKFVSRSIIWRDYIKYDQESLCIDIKNSNINLTDQFENVSKTWGHFYATLLNIFNKQAPIIKTKVRGKPSLWVTSELKKKINELDKCLKICRNTKREVDISSYKRKRNEVNLALRKAKSVYFKNLLNESKKLPREFWKTLKKICPVKS